MLIFGHKLIEYNKFEQITCIDDIKKTTSNSILYFKYIGDISILSHALNNTIPLAVEVGSFNDLIIVVSYRVDYVIVSNSLVFEAQNYVNNYLLDTKILKIIDTESDMEKAAKDEIDGVIFTKLLA